MQQLKAGDIPPMPEYPSEELRASDPLGYLEKEADYRRALDKRQTFEYQLAQQQQKQIEIERQQNNQYLEQQAQRLTEWMPEFADPEKRSVFIENLKVYLEKMSINADWEAIEVSSDEDLINSISMGCPFDVNEKQALLQAKSLDERVDILISLMKMSMSFSSVSGISEKLS